MEQRRFGDAIFPPLDLQKGTSVEFTEKNGAGEQLRVLRIKQHELKDDSTVTSFNFSP